MTLAQPDPLLAQAGWAALAVFGLLGSALWSGFETGFYSFNRVRLDVRAAAPGDRLARILRHEARSRDRLLTTVLIGNNACNYLGTLGLTGILALAGLDETSLIILQVLVLTPLLLVFGEAMPKELFRVEADRWTYAVAPVEAVTRWLLTLTGVLPIVLGFARLVARATRSGDESLVRGGRERLIGLLKDSAGAALSAEQTSLVDRAVLFNQEIVGDRMTPWASVVRVRGDWDRARALRALAEHGRSRAPVVGPEGRVRGAIDRLELHAHADRSVADLTQDVARLTRQMRPREALARLRASGVRLAVVEQEGRPIGIVTAADLLGTLLGAAEPEDPSG